MKWRSALAKTATALQVPPVKYSLIAVAVTLWGMGLVDQLSSTAATAKYLMLSLLIAAVAII